MNVGEVFSDSVRAISIPSAGGVGGLHVDVEQDLRVVAHEADRDDQHPARAVLGAAARASSTEGPSHGSGVRPALW